MVRLQTYNHTNFFKLLDKAHLMVFSRHIQIFKNIENCLRKFYNCETLMKSVLLALSSIIKTMKSEITWQDKWMILYELDCSINEPFAFQVIFSLNVTWKIRGNFSHVHFYFHCVLFFSFISFIVFFIRIISFIHYVFHYQLFRFYLKCSGITSNFPFKGRSHEWWFWSRS